MLVEENYLSRGQDAAANPIKEEAQLKVGAPHSLHCIALHCIALHPAQSDEVAPTGVLPSRPPPGTELLLVHSFYQSCGLPNWDPGKALGHCNHL